MRKSPKIFAPVPILTCPPITGGVCPGRNTNSYLLNNQTVWPDSCPRAVKRDIRTSFHTPEPIVQCSLFLHNYTQRVARLCLALVRPNAGQQRTGWMPRKSKLLYSRPNWHFSGNSRWRFLLIHLYSIKCAVFPASLLYTKFSCPIASGNLPSTRNKARHQFSFMDLVPCKARRTVCAG
jgi:hypothetical protein